MVTLLIFIYDNEDYTFMIAKFFIERLIVYFRNFWIENLIHFLIMF